MRSVSFFALALSVLALSSFVTVSVSYAQISAVGEDSLGGSAEPAPAQSPFGEEDGPQVIDDAAEQEASSATATTKTTPAPVTATATNDTATPVAPSQDQLSADDEDEDAPVKATTTVQALPDQTEGVAQGGNIMDPAGQTQKYSGEYFDSYSVVPDKRFSKSLEAPPTIVDPKFQPGTVFVYATGTAGAQSFESQYVAATRALKLQRYAAAMEMFEKLYKQESKDPRVLMGLAIAQQGAGFTESAAQTYEELLQVQPNNANAIVNLMGIMKNQYPSVTLTRLLELRQKYPSNPGIPAQIGLVNADLKNYDDAMRYFEIAASLEPGNASHIYNMAIVADHQGNPSKAIQFYERALQMDASVTGTATENLPREKIYDRLAVLRRKV